MPTLLHQRYCLLPAAIVMAIAPAGLIAQWPSYTAAGVPRTADGKPNLSAPAPRTSEGKPDLSGIWENFDNQPLRRMQKPRRPMKISLLGSRRTTISWPSPSGAHSGISVLRSRMVCRFSRGRRNCTGSALPTTAWTTLTRTACQWGLCSFTTTASRER